MKTSRSSFHGSLARSLVLLFLLLSLPTAAMALLPPPVITSPGTGTTLPSVTVGQSMSIQILSSGGEMPLDKWYQCDIDDPDDTAPCLPPG